MSIEQSQRDGGSQAECRLLVQIHPYTYRNEYVYLKWNFSMDAWKEYYAFFEIEGIDGAFTDFPSTQACII